MTLRAAREEDAPRIEAFLKRHAETSMFLRSNLAQFGASGAPDHPNSTQMWLVGRDGEIEGLLGLSRRGGVLPQWPSLSSGNAREWAAMISGREVSGVVGPPDQVDALRAGLGLDAAPAQMDEEEELYSLSLSDLRVPDGDTILRRPLDGDRPLLRRWRQAYLRETSLASAGAAEETAKKEVAGTLAEDRLRVLADASGAPCAMTAFNAVLPDMVQIGGVYTPPELRGRGLARRAVALHLAEARSAGVARAILFAANAVAARAYRAIGFQLAGSYTLFLLERPQGIAA